MIAAEGILTAGGGVSSHAALGARQMGKVCVCGAAGVVIDYDKKTTAIDGHTFSEGDFLSIDGTSGNSYAGQLKTAPSEIISGSLTATKPISEVQEPAQLMVVRAVHPRLRVRTNADNQEQTKTPSRSARPASAVPHRAHVLRGQPH